MALGFGSDGAGLRGLGASLGIDIRAMPLCDAVLDMSLDAARPGAICLTDPVSGMSLASRLHEKGPFDATRG